MNKLYKKVAGRVAASEKFEDGGTFSIEEAKFDSVVAESGKSANSVARVLFFNWDDVEHTHQQWLDNASIPAISAWVSDICEQWQLF